MDYFVPQTCVRCKDLCKGCGTRSESLKAGRCPSCDHKYRYGYCVGCGREVLKKYLNEGRCSECRLFACKSCNSWTKKSELQYGKCESCRRWEDELDYSRVCDRCGRPFLTNGQVRFFQQKGLTVQKRHKEGTYGCG